MSLAQFNSLLSADRQQLEGLVFFAENYPFLLTKPLSSVVALTRQLIAIKEIEAVPEMERVPLAQIAREFEEMAEAVAEMEPIVPSQEIEKTIPKTVLIDEETDRTLEVAMADPTNPRDKHLLISGWKTFRCVTCGQSFQHPEQSGRAPSKCFDHLESGGKANRLKRFAEDIAANSPT